MNILCIKFKIIIFISEQFPSVIFYNYHIVINIIFIFLLADLFIEQIIILIFSEKDFTLLNFIFINLNEVFH